MAAPDWLTPKGKLVEEAATLGTEQSRFHGTWQEDEIKQCCKAYLGDLSKAEVISILDERRKSR